MKGKKNLSESKNGKSSSKLHPKTVWMQVNINKVTVPKGERKKKKKDSKFHYI